MKTLMARSFGLFLVGMAMAAHAQYLWITNADGITLTITGYTGQGGPLNIPSSIDGMTVVNIADYAMQGGTSFTTIVIPGTVTNIGSSSFNGTHMTSVTMANGRDCKIDDFAFVSCENLTNVALSSGVTNIGFGNFVMCPNLQVITVDGENQYYSSVGGVLFDKAQNTLFFYPEGRGDYRIPSGVANIAELAFQKCYNLYYLILPSSVTNLENGCFGADTGLVGLFFEGNPPVTSWELVTGADTTFYY